MIAVALVALLAAAPPAPACGDFLAAEGRKPPHLDFVGCAAMPGRQGRPLRATYRVAGRFAAATEAYLVAHAGLHRLKRSCCQWDAPPAGFTGRGGRAFTLTMTSAETPVARRADWARIARFEVAVETLTDDV